MKAVNTRERLPTSHRRRRSIPSSEVTLPQVLLITTIITITITCYYHYYYLLYMIIIIIITLVRSHRRASWEGQRIATSTSTNYSCVLFLKFRRQ